MTKDEVTSDEMRMKGVLTQQKTQTFVPSSFIFRVARN